MAFCFLNWQYVDSKLVAAQIPAVDFDQSQANKVEMFVDTYISAVCRNELIDWCASCDSAQRCFCQETVLLLAPASSWESKRPWPITQRQTIVPCCDKTESCSLVAICSSKLQPGVGEEPCPSFCSWLQQLYPAWPRVNQLPTTAPCKVDDVCTREARGLKTASRFCEVSMPWQILNRFARDVCI